MKFVKSIILSALMVITLAASAQRKTVHVVALNDMHAFLDRAAALGGVIDSLRALYPELLVFSSGDNRTGNPVNDQYIETNRPMMEVMNAFGVNASAMGNHEYDGKVAGFKKNLKAANFPFLCANTTIPDSMGYKIDPYKIFDVDGIKVGVVSVVQINSRGIPDCLADNVEGISFSDPKAAAIKYGDIVRKQCDVEILLSHVGIENDTVYAFELGNYDAILGGHSHTYVASNTKYNNMIITQNVNKMKYCTLVEFVVENGEVVDKSSKIISVEASKLRNAKIDAMVKDYNKDPYFSTPVCTVGKRINNVDEMGAMVTDGQRSGSGADVTVQNYGGVRYETHEAGVFDVKDALMLDPFGNKMVVFNLTASQIKRIIMESYINDEYRYPFISGLSYEMVINKKTQKPQSVTLYNEKGKKVKDKKSFKFSCNDYVVSITFLKDMEGNPTGKLSCDCLMEYLKDKGTIDYTNVKRTKVTEE